MAGKTLKMKKDPFLILKDIFDVIKINNPSRFPLAGGGIGYFSYDLKDSIEKIPDTSINDLALPEMYFVLYQAIMAFDNEDPGKVLITVLDIRSDDLPKAQDLLISLKKTAVSGIPFAYADRRTSSGKPRSNFTKKDYITAVEKVKEYIRSGDIYQACLSQRFEADWARGPYLLYKKLNNLNPSPFSAFLNFEDCEILSSSPELFLRAGGKKIETRPMKGTRTRGKDPLTDKRMRNDLLKSDKDAAELSMIVDLERNDLGKIAVPGSVFVSEHRRIEKYSTVFQTISVINAELPDNISLPLVVKAAFPGGSISGCPKIRAMEIIEELEPTKRSVYTGCIGYISFHGTMDLNIAIRTITLKNGKAYYQTGGGITIDSAPEEEYRETLDKARAFFDILGADLI
jgi:para-aminobenzoate synthetase component 1